MALVYFQPENVKAKGTVRPVTRHEVPEGEYNYSSTLPLILVLDGGG